MFYTLLAAALSAALPALAQDVQRDNTIGLTAALKAAHDAVPGGLLDAELDRKDGKLSYEIDLIRDGVIHQIVVDARSGAVLSNKERKMAGAWNGMFNKDEMRAAQPATGALLESIASAEKASGRQVTDISLDDERGQWRYELDVAGMDRDIIIDAQTGQLISGSSLTGAAR